MQLLQNVYRPNTDYNPTLLIMLALLTRKIWLKWSWSGVVMLTNLHCRSLLLFHQTSCCNDFLALFSVWPLYRHYNELIFGNSPIFIYFLENFPFLWTHINLSIFNLFLIYFIHRTKHKPISYYKQIEWKMWWQFVFTTVNIIDGSFGHDGFASNFYFHFWGNSSSSFKQVYIMYK